MKKWMKSGFVVVSAFALATSLALVGCASASSSGSPVSSTDVSSESVPTDEPAKDSTSIIANTTNMASVRMNIKESVSDTDVQTLVDKIAQLDSISDVKYVNSDEAHERGYGTAFIEYAFSDDKDTAEIINGVLAVEGASDAIENEYEKGKFVSSKTGKEEDGTYMLVRRYHTTDAGVFIESVDYVLVEDTNVGETE